MKKIFTLLFLAVSFNFYGQVGFERNVVIDQYYGGIQQNGVIAADFDNDGKVDILQMSYSSLIWFKNIDSNGKFSTGKFICTTGFAKKIVAADIDNDGDLDIVCSQYPNSTLNIFCVKNNGNGTFASPVTLVSNFSATAKFQLVDMDNDGDLDLVYDKAGIGWLKNGGQGTFTQVGGTISPATDYFYFADVTGDGKADMITDIGNDMKVFSNNGSAAFTQLQVIDNNASGGMITSADIDNDGDNDILFLHKNATTLLRTVKWYKNNNGVFEAGQNLVDVQPGQNTGASIFIITDLDGDGAKDILMSTSEINKVAWHKNMGNMTFGAEQLITTDAIGVNDIAVGDINSDGRPDVLSTSIPDNKLAWYKNTIAGFGTQTMVGRTAHDTNFTAAGDMDGDGDTDLVSASSNLGQIAWYKNSDGQGNFSQEDQKLISRTFKDVKNVMVADFDGDGDLDVIAANSYYNSESNLQSTCKLFKNNGTGSFSEQVLIPEEQGSVVYHYADIDNDGDIDIISLVNSIMYVRKNNGDGIMAAALTQAPWSANTQPSKLMLADINGDGNTDLIVFTQSFGIYWYENNGSGVFTAEHSIDQYSLTGFTIIADIDNDGDNDLLCTYPDLNAIAWFKNIDGQGTFGQRIDIPTGTQDHHRIAVYDFDGDGHNDIVSTTINGINFSWYKNDGQQNMSGPIEIDSSLHYASSLGVADFNADGKGDIFTSTSIDQSVNWFKNLGPFNNIVTGTVRLGDAANGCTVADAGVPQVLVTTQSGGNTWSTFTNANGGYTAYGNQGTFTTSITSNLPGFNANPQSHQSVFANNNGSSNTADFCLQAIAPATDLEVNIYRLAEVRPGFPVQYRVVAKNNGTTQVAGSAVVNFDIAKLNFNSAGPAATSQTGNTVTFDLGTMLPFAVKEFSLNFTAKTIPTISLGDEVVLSANVAVANDATPANNTAQNTTIVVGSYDPNDITVREGSQILLENADEYLHYLIRFQNTGNYYAERVVVKNPLDSKLDWTTMQIEGMSHTGRIEIINGTEATFTFDAIYLPAMTVNEPASHGYIAYKIKPKANVALGDTFTEQAHIYFDFNPAIDTNIVTTTIVDNVNGVPQFTAETVSVYPVPSRAVLNVKANSDIAKIEIYNHAGQRVLTGTMQNSIDISALSHGIYFAKIENVHGSTVTKKVVKN